MGWDGFDSQLLPRIFRMVYIEFVHFVQILDSDYPVVLRKTRMVDATCRFPTEQKGVWPIGSSFDSNKALESMIFLQMSLLKMYSSATS